MPHIEKGIGFIMSTKEKVAYLTGLAEGLGLGSDSKEGKLILAIIDTLSVMADEIEELNDNALDIGEELDAISNDLADVEDFIYDDDFDDDDDDYDIFGDDDDDFDDDDECDCEYCKGEDFSYEVACPSCGAEIVLNEDDLAHGSAKCVACGEEIEFDYDSDEDEDDDEEPLKF